MKGLPNLSCAACLTATVFASFLPASPARADSFGGFVLLKGSDYDLRGEPLDPDDVFSLPNNRLEAAVLAEGEVHSLHFRVRLESTGAVPGDAKGADDDWPGKPVVRLQQLYIPLYTSDDTSIEVGKQTRSWDQGLSFTPLGFFRSNPNVRDPVDVEGRVEGLPMLVVSHIGRTVALEGVVSDRLGSGSAADRRNGRQVAVKASGQPLPKLDLAIIARLRDGAKPGIGLSTDYAIGRIELHADAYFGEPEAQWDSAALFRSPPALRSSSPAQLDDGRHARISSVVGGSLLVGAKTTLRAEWAHHGDGATAAQWHNFLANLDLHRAARAEGVVLATANLGWDLAALKSGGVRRDYAFLGASYAGDVVAPSLFSLVGLADGSTTTTLSLTWHATVRLDIALQATVLTGSATSEFGIAPFKRIVGVRLMRVLP